MKCEQCEKVMTVEERVELLNPFDGELFEVICQQCNENRYDSYIESFYG